MTLTIKINNVPDQLLEKGLNRLSDFSGITFGENIELECTPDWLFGHLINDEGSFSEFLANISNQLAKQNLTVTQQKEFTKNIDSFMKSKEAEEAEISDEDKKWVDGLLKNIGKPENLN